VASVLYPEAKRTQIYISLCEAQREKRTEYPQGYRCAPLSK